MARESETSGEWKMRRDELFQVVPRTPHPSVPPFHRQRNRIIRRTFRFPIPLPPSSFLVFFFAVFSRLPLLISRFSYLLSCAHVRMLILQRLVSRVDTDPIGYSLATLFFLTFPCAQLRHKDDDGKMHCRISSCHVLARDDRTLRREFTSRDTTAESYQRWSLQTGQFLSNLSTFRIAIISNIFCRLLHLFPHTYNADHIFMNIAGLAAMKWAL